MFVEKENNLDWKDNLWKYKISKVFAHNGQDCYFAIQKDPLGYCLFFHKMGDYTLPLLNTDTLQKCYDHADSYYRYVLCL